MPDLRKGFSPDAPFRPRRAWGQNFLVDTRAVGIIVRAFGPRPDDRVLEVSVVLKYPVVARMVQHEQ